VKGAPPIIDDLILIAPGADGAAVRAAAERGVIIGEGANLARSLSNRSANDISPEVLADEARAVAERHGLWIDVIEPERATELGMGMFMAVGQGSDNPPRMIVMRSGGSGERDALDRHLAIIGKGVCFDSGGISIKPSDRMEEMKMDKIGACTVIAAIGTVARLAPGTPLLAIAPAVENMPGSHSTRPGDVVRAMNGKWVDITNTDAEGRLILGDAMTYAEQLGATHIVDVATLTGAVGRAFGHLVTGAFGTPQSFYDDVIAAGERAAERYWQVPLVDDYVADMESWYGDLQNSGSAEGSLVKSGLFLREFRTVPWAHLDIGGTGYFRKTMPYAARGATGVTHATLVELALAGASPD
jgi:leucyl aminopeptidase